MTPEQELIVSELGFEICECPPDSDPCEECKEPNHQLFVQTSFGESRYLCLECILLEHAENQHDISEIMRLEKEGHTAHCGARHVWGDGQCECEKKGIIPGAISRIIAE